MNLYTHETSILFYFNYEYTLERMITQQVILNQQTIFCLYSSVGYAIEGHAVTKFRGHQRSTRGHPRSEIVSIYLLMQINSSCNTQLNYECINNSVPKKIFVSIELR